jgi:hypothetical protein
MRRTLGLAIAVVLGFVAVVRAEPLDLKQVAADAKWAAHLDVDALHASTLFQKAREELLRKHPEAEKPLAMLAEVWKFNPVTDLHSITIYGKQIRKGTGVAIVRAKVDQNLLLEKAKLAPEHQVKTYGKYELHSWIHAKGSKHERGMTGTFYKPDVMIFGVSADEVTAALDVLDGTKPNLADKEPALSLATPPGTILSAGVGGLADTDLPCKSPLVKQADSLILAIGESQGQVFVNGMLTAKQADVAQQVKTIMDGALALATLAHNDDAESLKLINAVKVTIADRAVVVEARAAVDDVWAHMQKAMAKKAAHKDGRHHGAPDHHPVEKK